MIVCIENLEAGIDWWVTSVPKWGADIMNSEYKGIYDQREGGITKDWWDACVTRLWSWMAIRSRNPPNTKNEIKERGLDRLEAIATEYIALRSIFDKEPTIADVSWDQIQAIFKIAREIKWGQRRNASPVFACKMCHFLFPKVFPVIDNFATGIFEYEFYWRGMREEWLRFPDKEPARILLKNSIIRSTGSGEAIHALYPWETKIIELSHIGYVSS
jgi:hypothetical protein